MDEERRSAAIKHLEEKRDFTTDVVSYVVVNAFLIGIWAVTGAGYFWPVWILGAWGMGLVLHAWTVYGRRPISEAEIERELHRGAPRAA